MNRPQMSEAERSSRSRVRKRLEEGMIRGTLVRRARVCGKPNCRCTRGQRHVSLYLTRRKDGGYEQLYIPAAREEEVRRQVENWRRLQDLLEEISSACWERLKRKGEGRS